MSVNKLWTLWICNKQEDRVNTFGLVSSLTRIWMNLKITVTVVFLVVTGSSHL